MICAKKEAENGCFGKEHQILVETSYIPLGLHLIHLQIKLTIHCAISSQLQCLRILGIVIPAHLKVASLGKVALF